MFSKISFKSVQAVVISVASLVSANAFATQYTFLGGAASLAHCQIMAGQAGFNTATFGGYVNGIYYWNACLGSNRPVVNPYNPNNQPMTMLQLAQLVQDRALDFDWHVVSHDDSYGNEIHDALWQLSSRVYDDSTNLTLKAKKGATRYELYDDIMAMRANFRRLAAGVSQVQSLMDQSDLNYWRRLDAAMTKLVTVQ
jgi:hypothetical protein